ncbi:50S ribosomal protein L18 [bacterium]|nr:50S ribosomal protein L18 [bacterium]|tara:strand:+ start:1199 stop:1552 length:354 start_codon:yes stop_codon:yes gene_type:complete
MKNISKIKQKKRIRRHQKVRAKIKGTVKRPRLSIFRSNKAIFAQLINDEKGLTLVSVHSREVKKDKPVIMAHELGKLVAERAINLKIKKVVFDRGGYKYHGRVKAVASGARDGGLKF